MQGVNPGNEAATDDLVHALHLTRSRTMTAHSGAMIKGRSLSDKIIHFLHHKNVHMAVIGLLIIDVLLVVVSIALEIEFLGGQVKECTAVATAALEHAAHEPAEALELIHHCHTGNHHIHAVESSLAWVSVGILGIFLVEQTMLLCAMGCAVTTWPPRRDALNTLAPCCNFCAGWNTSRPQCL
jgi:hypothetical protein